MTSSLVLVISKSRGGVTDSTLGFSLTCLASAAAAAGNISGCRLVSFASPLCNNPMSMSFCSAELASLLCRSSLCNAPPPVYVPNDLEQVGVKQLASHRHLYLIERVLEHIICIQVIDPAQHKTSVHMRYSHRAVAAYSPLICSASSRPSKLLRTYVDLRNSSISGVPESTTSRNLVPVRVWKQWRSNVSAVSRSMPVHPGTGDS